MTLFLCRKKGILKVRTVNFKEKIFMGKIEYDFVKEEPSQGEYRFIVKPKSRKLARQVDKFGRDILGNHILRNEPEVARKQPRIGGGQKTDQRIDILEKKINSLSSNIDNLTTLLNRL